MVRRMKTRLSKLLIPALLGSILALLVAGCGNEGAPDTYRGSLGSKRATKRQLQSTQPRRPGRGNLG